MVKLAVVATHPIQYHAPWFRELAAQKGIELKVYFAMMPDEKKQGVGFGVPFSWDIPLLEGYDWELLPNKKDSPDFQGFFSSSTPAIHSIFAKTKPDVAIITGWQSLPLLQALWASIRLSIPRVIRGESNALRKRPLHARLLHRMLLSRFNAFLAIGQANRDFYLGYGIRPERIFSSNYFVDNSRFQNQAHIIKDQREAIREGWQIPAGHTCFLYAGKLEPKKRLIDLLEALDRAKKKNSRIHLLVAGAGELMAEAKNMVEGRRLPVTFAGFLNQTEITRAYVAADCLVLASDFGETWGLVVNEAMACGLPVIVSDRVGCGPDLVEEGVTGSVFPCGDVVALSEKILTFASDPEGLARMGRHARARVSQYSVEQAVAGTVSAINYVLSKSSHAMIPGVESPG